MPPMWLGHFILFAMLPSTSAVKALLPADGLPWNNKSWRHLFLNWLNPLKNSQQNGLEGSMSLRECLQRFWSLSQDFLNVSFSLLPGFHCGHLPILKIISMKWLTVFSSLLCLQTASNRIVLSPLPGHIHSYLSLLLFNLVRFFYLGDGDTLSSSPSIS